MSAAVDAHEALATILRGRVVPIVRTRSTAWAADVAEILATSGMDVNLTATCGTNTLLNSGTYTWDGLRQGRCPAIGGNARSDRK